MAKKIILHSGFWHKQKVNKLNSKDSSLVFAYLLCNPKVNRIGIYTIFSEEIASGIGRKIIDAEEVRKALIELEESGLIKYEHESDVVYIINFRQYSNFDSGKPIIIAKELLYDFEEFDRDNLIVFEFWKNYIEFNIDQLKSFENRLSNSKSNIEKLTIISLINFISH